MTAHVSHPSDDADSHPPGPRLAERHLDAAELFERYGEFVAKFFWCLGAKPQQIEDLVQEVFMVAHRRGGFIEQQAKATTWLSEIAMRVFHTRKRSWLRRREQFDDETVNHAVAKGPSPLQEAETAERLRRAHDALSTLTLEQRSVFILSQVQGLSAPEVASALEVPVGTVYSRLHSARRRFFEAHGEEAPVQVMGAG